MDQAARLYSCTEIISDWSGVISNDMHLVFEASMRMLEKRGKPRILFEELYQQAQPSMSALFVHLGCAPEDTEALNLEYKTTLKDVKTDGITPVLYKDALPFVQALAPLEKRMGAVVSSHPLEHLMREATGYGLLSHIPNFIGSVTDKVAAIERIIEHAGIPRSRYLYMGDMTYDVIAAKKAGVLSVAIATGYHTAERLAQAEPDILVHSLTELSALFQEAHPNSL